MRITMNLYYTGQNGSARKFAEEMEQSGTAAKIRAEAGNERYEYFFPMNDPETALREKYDLHMRAERYLSDDAGMPDADKKFIKT